MPTAFDRALELDELRFAAEAYASRRGEPGSTTYRAAWLRFRQRIQSIEDLQRVRRSSARPKPIDPKTPAAPAGRGIRLPKRVERSGSSERVERALTAVASGADTAGSAQ